MKRREVLQSAASSLVAALSVSALVPSYAQAAPDSAIPSVAKPEGCVPITMPAQLYAMPSTFWQHFTGVLWLGQPDVDPTLAGNQIPVFLQNRAGATQAIQQPIRINHDNLQRLTNNQQILIASPAHAMALYDDHGQQLFYLADARIPSDVALVHRLLQPNGYQLIGEVASIAALRQTRPLFAGAKIKLKSWHDGLVLGGGEFVGFYGTAKDDGGTLIAGDQFYWRRVVTDINALTLFDFGAIADGKTDAKQAIEAMYAWSIQGKYLVGVQFPAGEFFVSQCVFHQQPQAYFRLAGATVNFGYFPATTLISDGQAAFVFSVDARRVEISNLVFYGRGQAQAKQQGFFHNRCQGGQFFRGSCLRFIAVGGTALSLLDTLDCKIDQWYASHCTGTVIKARWSDRSSGRWDHSTAIELSNFNAQYCRTGRVLDLPRCTQSLIHNGWIEHCDHPGDLTDGQWIIDALSLEDCANALIAHNARLNMRQINLQTGGWIDNARQGESWLSAWEMGSTQIESFGMSTEGCLKYGYLTSTFRLTNTALQPVWFNIGSFYSPAMGDSWEVEIFGQSACHAQAQRHQLSTDQGTAGKAVITLLRKAGGTEVTWFAAGASPLTEVCYVTPFATDTQLYVKLAGASPASIVLVKTSGKDRFSAGVCARFTPRMIQQDPPSTRQRRRALPRFTLHNGKAAIGANEQGDLLLTSRSVAQEQVDLTKPAGYFTAVINGQRCAIPWFSLVGEQSCKL